MGSNRKQYLKEWYLANKDLAKAQANAWHKANPERSKQNNIDWQAANKQRRKGTSLRRKYWPHLSWSEALEEYNRILINQGDSCAICLKHKSNFTTDLCVDHNHLTGEVRGLLCKHCNTTLGHLDADSGPDLLLRALSYLKKE